MNNTWICGDIHLNFKAFKQCLERSNFDYENDLLIQLGDLVDGGVLDGYYLIEELLKIKNKILISGNHDQPFLEYLETGIHPWKWQQGGISTARSYLNLIGKPDAWQPSGSGYITSLNPGDIPESHKELFKSQVDYYIDDNKNLFIHGGFNRHHLLSEQSRDYFSWDRDLWMQALSYESMRRNALGDNKDYKFKIKENFKNIYIGHTTTMLHSDECKIMRAANIVNLDVGAGHTGRLVFLNLDTQEEIYSDFTKEIYPNFKGRS